MEKDIKFLVDVGVGKKVESYLKEMRYDIKCIREIDFRMRDVEILRIANEDKRTVITMDKDFGELVFNSGKEHRGVLLLRLDDANGEEKVIVVREIIENYENVLQNNFCVYQNSKFRVKRK